jgi:7-keto-8-aminopelargonate synthetase-like enzyme
MAALRIVSSEECDRRMAALVERAARFHDLISDHIDTSRAGHIVPVKIGDSRVTMQVSAKCLAAGVFVQGIRYPTVPEGTARLRFSLMSTHTREDLHKAADALKTALADT